MTTAPLTETKRASLERTEHPHIVKSEGTLGGKARIEGTRISVYLLWEMHRGGTSVDEIIETYPWLSPGQIHDAISYAYDHEDEMVEAAERSRLRTILKEHNLVYQGGFLLRPGQLPPPRLPPETPTYTWETLPPELDE